MECTVHAASKFANLPTVLLLTQQEVIQATRCCSDDGIGKQLQPLIVRPKAIWYVNSERQTCIS